MSIDASTATTAPASQTFPFLRKHIELIIAILLGLVAIVTAYASFQSSLYDGNMTQAYTVGSNMATEAESQYLEANQQYIQDAQLYDRLTDLQLDSQSSDPILAASASEKYDILYFQSVSEEFGLAIDWADEQNAADSTTYYSPLDNEDYLDQLYSGYDVSKDEADATIAKGDVANGLSDKLTLNTVMMAISLFLLGIAAVVRQFRIQVILGTVAIVIFLTAVALTIAVPALPLW